MDSLEAENILKNAALVQAQMDIHNQISDLWFEDQIEDDPHCPSGKVIHSAVIQDHSHYGKTACIFLRSDSLCALQVASEANNYHPWHFKPFYCILHPLDLTEDSQITLDEKQALLDEPASCLRPAIEDIPLLETFKPELTYLLGQEEYNTLIKTLNRKGNQKS